MQEDNQIQETTSQEQATVGMYLKYTRQSQKKSVETVAKALCIRKIYIKAIEESDFNELPPVPYGIGFIRSYADYLGLNAERIVQCYKEESMPKKNDASAKPIVKKHTSLTMPNLKQILTGVGLVVFLYLLVLMFGSDFFKHESKPVENEVTQEQPELPVEQIFEANYQDNISVEDNYVQTVAEVSSDTVTVVEENYVEPEVETNFKPAEQKNKIVVKFNGESWFEIKDNKQVYISGIYQKGFEYEIPDVPNLIFSVGRYFNVDVFINDELVKVAGPKKQTNIKLDDFLNH